MITTFLIDEHGKFQSGGQELINQWRANPLQKIWVDIEFSDKKEVNAILEGFDIHPLAIEDALRTRHPPKIEFFDNQLFILYRGIAKINGSLDFVHQQIGIFISNNFVISTHSVHSPGIATAQKQLATMKQKTPMQIAINIMRFASFLYLENVLEFESRLSDLEDKFQTHGDDQLLAELTSYKAKLIKLIRAFNYHRTISESLLSEAEDHEYIDAETHYHAMNDLNDRFDRLTTLSQMHYDICGDLIDGYLSISAHQLNVTMRVLTVITAIFIPLGFLAGLYGMNFENMPELKYAMSYYVLLGFMVFIAATLLVFFKKKKWL